MGYSSKHKAEIDHILEIFRPYLETVTSFEIIWSKKWEVYLYVGPDLRYEDKRHFYCNVLDDLRDFLYFIAVEMEFDILNSFPHENPLSTPGITQRSMARKLMLPYFSQIPARYLSPLVREMLDDYLK